ncbi:Dehydrogenase [Symmachiella dynata]|uniref:Dehydrogenase n=1 Tax=Symmachiella dynata TaxID=2527995 RepID=A0A517ZUT5_9PLAN|nr:Gfo/Idh/MocA family oxidoreductase [Symmachiella dynata]QDU46252.1 Dehydrogenase [Symmachiella dynata]
MKQIKIAVIGVGALGQHHARILAGMPDVELVGVADTNREAGMRVAHNCGTQWFSEYRDMLDNVDAVSVAVPTMAHLAVAGDCLSRGISAHVEKPLALDATEGSLLVKQAEKTGAILQVGHIERFNPAMQSARPHIGQPKYIRGERLSPFSFRSTDIGVTLDLMIHDIDLVLDLAASPIVSVEAFGLNILGNNEDVVQARLRFENGCVADLTANRVSMNVSRSMQVWSNTGFVGIDFGARQVTTCAPSDALLYGTSPVERAQQPGADIEKLKTDVFEHFIRVENPTVTPHDALTAELSSFVDCIRTQQKPLVDGQTGLLALKAAEQILESVAAHAWDGNSQGAIGPAPFFAAPRKLAG